MSPGKRAANSSPPRALGHGSSSPRRIRTGTGSARPSRVRAGSYGAVVETPGGSDVALERRMRHGTAQRHPSVPYEQCLAVDLLLGRRLLGLERFPQGCRTTAHRPGPRGRPPSPVVGVEPDDAGARRDEHQPRDQVGSAARRPAARRWRPPSRRGRLPVPYAGGRRASRRPPRCGRRGGRRHRCRAATTRCRAGPARPARDRRAGQSAQITEVGRVAGRSARNDQQRRSAAELLVGQLHAVV